MGKVDDFAPRERRQRQQYIPARALLIPPAHPGAAALDLGCGAGEMSVEARTLGWHVIGADLRDENLVRITREDGIPTVMANFEKPLPFADGAFDLVIHVEVIEHILHMEDTLAQIHRVLRPGGELIITTPNVAYFTYRWRGLLGRPPKGEGYHLRFLTSHTFRKKLSEAGFATVARTSNNKRFPSWMPIPLFLEPLLSKRLAYRCKKV